jgi:RNA polymerase sigma-70 factor (ECF subfamily)
VFTEFCEKESVDHILQCIKEMDERYTDVLRLYYLQENTTREIAKLLSLNVKTVETRLSRGRALLYKKLKESGMD